MKKILLILVVLLPVSVRAGLPYATSNYVDAATNALSGVLVTRITNATNDLNAALTNRMGTLRLAVTNCTTTFTVTTNMYMVRVDTSGGDYVITLPATAACKGQAFVLKKVSQDVNVANVTCAGGDLIDGVSPFGLNGGNDALRIQSDGGGHWDIE